MATETIDQVSIQIDACLGELSQTSSQPCIFKVYDRLRSVNKKAYEPEVIAIGPYHHGKPKLQRMEGQKLRYLNQLLRRRREGSVNRYVTAIRNELERARECYAECISMSDNEFVAMLVLDGCFIIELFHKHGMCEPRDTNDIYLQTHQLLYDIRRDLMLVENQLPLFVLTILFNLTKSEGSQEDIKGVALKFFDALSLQHAPNQVEKEQVYASEIKHLVCLVHKYWCSPFATIRFGLQEQEEQEEQVQLMRSATELKGAGVKFKKVERRTLLDIRFSKGVMEIPCLYVGDETDFMARNLIAYEQYLTDDYSSYVTDYFHFIGCLVNSSKDVKLLREEGIIDNWLGDDEVVVALINKLGDDTSLWVNRYYKKIFLEVDKHCNKRVNKWMANLNQNYLNTPWAVISVLAAALLLLLTAAQTVFSIIK